MFAQFDLFFARFDWCWCRWIYFYAFRFICLQFDSFLWGSIHLCTVRFMFVPVRFNFCAIRFIFWAVRFIFAWFDSFFAVLIFCDRFSFYLCAFHIVHFVAWRFWPYRSAILYRQKTWLIMVLNQHHLCSYVTALIKSTAPILQHKSAFLTFSDKLKCAVLKI